ncbi:hypothetical protein FGADI_12941 [Fusarium gaditjirri]|uniref:Major facilitator superfamily (MFS) profile domain-containing protein n=1 Tax=Fusarium gaditjirri TaxID=282569 RepID=A0A8H4WNG9_9HYPO|nr:hypothetical protein FGADI_12941 [Fusarium gaditjirri]
MEPTYNQKNELAVEHSEGDGVAANGNIASQQSHGYGVAPIEEKQLPKGYYYSIPLLGTFFAIALGLTCGAGAFAMIAPVLGAFNAEIGPSANITGVAIVYILTLGTGSLLVGRLTDLFGRRWFFVGGSLLAVIGTAASQTSFVESQVQTLAGIAIDGQNDIGAAVGFSSSARSFGGALATTIYSTILANRLKMTIPKGQLPADKVPGLTPDIVAVGLDAYQTANSQAYKTCFLASIAFCRLGLIAVWFCDDLDPKMDHIVAKELHHWGDEKQLSLANEGNQTEGQV